MLTIPASAKPIDPDSILPLDTVCVQVAHASSGFAQYFAGVVHSVNKMAYSYCINFGKDHIQYTYSVPTSTYNSWTITCHLLSRPPQWKPLSLADLKTIPLGSRVKLNVSSSKFVAEGALTSRLESQPHGFSYYLEDGNSKIWSLFDKDLTQGGHQVLIPS